MSERFAGILLNPDSRITCPYCKQEFAVSDGFASRALEQVEAASSAALAKLREEERAALERRALVMAQERDAAHTKALADVRSLTAQTFTRQIEALKEQHAGDQVAFDKHMAEQSVRLQALQAEQLALRQERQKLQDEKAVMALEVQKKADAQIQQREAVIRAQEQGRSQLEKAELQKKLDDAGEQLAAAQRKMEQGSQQLQGEVLELAIEENIRRAFPLDNIEEVKKGQRGGDMLQQVMTRTGQAAGTILWETKRARDWGLQWIPKLKEDMRACNAAVGILVTIPGALPRDWPAAAHFALYDDIWVTQPTTAVGVAEAIRSGLIDLQRQRVLSAGKGEKAEAMYDYVTSPQFAQKLRAVGEAFQLMRKELESEMTVTKQRWARREKQLEAGMTQLLGIGGGIQGLAQQDLPELEMGDEPSLEP